MKQLYCRDLIEWRSWLQTNHTREAEIWLLYLKGKGTAQKLSYEEAG